MSVTLNGRSWSISDFQDFAHAQPKSPDTAGTPAFPDGIFGDMLAEASAIAARASSVASHAAVVAAASTLLAALQAQAPALSSATYNGDLRPNRTGTGYNLMQWSTYAASANVAVGSHKIFFNTSGGAFRIVLQGTPSDGDLIEIGDFSRTFGVNAGTFIFNSSIAGSIYGGAATVEFDVAGDHALYQFWSGKWREL